MAKPLCTRSLDFLSSALAKSVRFGLLRSATRNVGCLPVLLGTVTVATAQSLPPSLFLPEAVLPRQTVEAAPYPVALPTGQPRAPISKFRYEFKGQTKSLDQYLSEAKVRALLVLKDGKIVHEFNRFPYHRRSLHQSWSIGKQVLSALVGVAIAEGAIGSVDDRMLILLDIEKFLQDTVMAAQEESVQ